MRVTEVLQQVPRGSKVLVVSGQQHILWLLEVNLARAGYSVVRARDGTHALDTAKRETADLIVLDKLGPPVDDRAVLRRLDADPETKHIPVATLRGSS